MMENGGLACGIPIMGYESSFTLALGSLMTVMIQ